MKNVYIFVILILFSGSLFAQQTRLLEDDKKDDSRKELIIEKDQKAFSKSLFQTQMTKASSSAVYQLDSMIYERYDSWDSSWYVDDMEHLFYNAQKQCVGEMDFDFSPDKDTSVMNWYAYDANGNWTETIGAYWSYGEWDTNWREVMTYNAAGQYLGMIEYDYYNGQWEEYWKSEYTYDNNGFLISREYFDWDVNMWEPEYLDLFFYHADGRILAEVELEYDLTSYQNDDSTFFEYDAAQKLVKQERFRWDNNMWEYRSFYDYSYNMNGDLESRTYYYYYINNWDTSYRYLYTFNQDYLMERIDQTFSNGAWENNYKDIYTYDMNYVYPQFTANPYYLDDEWAMYLKEEEYEWDNNNSYWREDSRDIFYWSHTGIDIAEEEPLENIKIYPVPTTDQLHVEFIDPDKATIWLYDLTGTLLLERSVNTNRTTLNLSNYATGVYLLRLEQNGAEIVKKLIIQ